ncbi:MAG: MOSC domain-containing protein [Anaerolineae bacterium]
MINVGHAYSVMGVLIMGRNLSGRVEGVYAGLQANSLVTTSLAAERVVFEGFERDRHAGLTRRAGPRESHYPHGTEIRNSRQISIVSVEELAEIAAAMDLPEIRPEWLGANLAFRGVPKLTLLPPSTRLFFPENAVLVVDAENLPCTDPGRVIQQEYPDRSGLDTLFPKAALHKRGLVAWVERPGLIRPGDEVRVEIPTQVVYDFLRMDTSQT